MSVKFDGAGLTIEDSPEVLATQEKFSKMLVGELAVGDEDSTTIAARDISALGDWLKPDRENRPVGVTLPEAGYRLFLDSQNRLRYSKEMFVDMRYPHLPWQVYGWSRDRYLNNLKKYIFKLLPRRHGKTFDDGFKGVSLLCILGSTRNNPVMAYYCPAKEQAMRNAWNALTLASANIPGVKYEKGAGRISWPSPTLQNPQSVSTILFFGIRGGGDTKRGGYYDICIMDEIEFYSIPFVEEVGFNSIFDRDGYFIGSGTPKNMGVMDHYMDKAESCLRIQDSVAKGEPVDMDKVPADWNQWHAVRGDCWSLKVYPEDKLNMLRATLGEERFSQEMECKNPESIKLYYYRDAITMAEKKKSINHLLRQDENLPLRVYYDFGIGEKTDRMAWGVWQHDNNRPVCLAGGVIAGKNFSDIVAAVKNSPYGESAFFEHNVPHDVKAKEQSDGVEKIKKFRAELKRQGVAGWQNTNHLPRHKNPILLVGEVGEVLKYQAQFHELHAAPILECLKNHKRKYNKENDIVEESPSKTRFRDGADMVRYAVIDWKSGEYLRRMERLVGGAPERRELVNYDDHPMEGSILDVDGADEGYDYL